MSKRQAGLSEFWLHSKRLRDSADSEEAALSPEQDKDDGDNASLSSQR